MTHGREQGGPERKGGGTGGVPEHVWIEGGAERTQPGPGARRGRQMSSASGAHSARSPTTLHVSPTRRHTPGGRAGRPTLCGKSRPTVASLHGVNIAGRASFRASAFYQAACAGPGYPAAGSPGGGGAGRSGPGTAQQVPQATSRGSRPWRRREPSHRRVRTAATSRALFHRTLTTHPPGRCFHSALQKRDLGTTRVGRHPRRTRLLRDSRPQRESSDRGARHA